MRGVKVDCLDGGGGDPFDGGGFVYQLDLVDFANGFARCFTEDIDFASHVRENDLVFVHRSVGVDESWLRLCQRRSCVV